MVPTSRAARPSTASTPGSPACSMRWWRARRSMGARSPSTMPRRRSRCREWSAWWRSRGARRPPSSIRWGASRSSGATPGRPSRAARRSISSGPTARTASTIPRPSRRRSRRRRGSRARWSVTRETSTPRWRAPQAARDRIAKRLGLSAENVKVNVTLLGGGFGRKSKPDFMIEAAVLSKAMGGAPVKVTWTREDDLHNSYYHTVSVERLEAGLDAGGKPVAWLHRTVAPSIMSTFNPEAKNEAPFELGMTAINIPFMIPNVRIENPEATAHTRIGWFRSVSNIPHAFAVQSFVAELAAAAGRDPKDFLLELIGPARRIDPRTLGDTWNHGEI